MIFVDTGAWFALSVPTDLDHAAANSFVQNNREPLFSTDYFVDELLTLFRVRRQAQRTSLWMDEDYFRGGLSLIRVTTADFDRDFAIYRSFADKLWSFTDCTSFAVMERLGTTQAFAFDDHFRQLGAISILP